MSRGRRRSAVLGALALVLAGLAPLQARAAPAGAAAPTAKPTAPARSHRVQRGVLRLLTSDVRGATGATHDVQRPLLVLPNGRWVDLHLQPGRTPSYNEPVELTGVGSDSQLDVESIRPLTGSEAGSAYPVAAQGGTTTATSSASSASSTQPTTGTTSVLVILASWTHPDAVTPASAANVIFTQGNPWWKESSYGQLAITGRVTNWVSISPPSSDCYSAGDTIMSRARAAAASYNPSAYQRVIVYFPACPGSPGWAFVGYGEVWLNGTMDLRTSIHEQGHNYGLGHAHSYECASGNMPVTLGGTCSPVEYGDPFDAMGGGSYVGHFSGRHKDLLGWLGSARKANLSGTDDVTLTPMETASGIKTAVVTVSSGRSYWLEYRTATGKDKGFPVGGQGVQVRLVASAVGDGGPNLLDQRPGDVSYDDFDSVTLPGGSSWTSPENIRITVGSLTATQAPVHVQGGLTAKAPSEPGGLNATAGDASAVVHWTKPADNGAIISSYVVTASPGGKTQAVPTLGGVMTTATMTGLTNGTGYSFTVVAKNSVGSSPASTPTPVVTPTIAVPAVSLTAPTAGAVVTGETLHVTVSTSPSAVSHAPVAAVEYLLDGLSQGYSSVTPFATDLDLRYTDPGAHVLTAVAYDQNDRKGSAAPVSFSYAPPVPTVSITAPTDGTALVANATTVTIKAVPGTNAHPITSVFATLEDGSYAGGATVDPSSPTAWTFLWDLTGLAEGPHVLMAQAVDDQQKTARSTPVTVTINHPSPTVSLVSPVEGDTRFGPGSVLVHVAPNPNGGGDVQSAQVVADGVTLLGTVYAGNLTPGQDPWPVTVDWRELSNGPHTLTGKATNADGYSTTTAPVRVTIANPSPTGAVTSPAQGSTLTGTVTLHATATPDAVSAAPITGVVFSADGTQLGSGIDNGSGDWTFAWDTAPGEQGAHTLSVTVTDNQGYTGTGAGVGVVLDNPGPRGVLTAPASGAVLLRPPGTTCDTDSGAGAPLHADVSRNPVTSTPVLQVLYLLDGSGVAYGDSTTPGWDAVLADCYLQSGPHQLAVQVYDQDGLVRTSSQVDIVLVGRPDDPSSLRWTAGADQVALTWTAPDLTGGVPLAGYRVQRLGEDGSTVLQSIDVGAVTSYALTGLTGDHLNARVLAYGPGGDSPGYNVSYVDLAPPPVTGLVLSGATGTINATWTPSVATDVAAVEVRVVEGTVAPDPTAFADDQLDGTATRSTLTGLTPGKDYTVSVLVQDRVGQYSTAAVGTLLGTALTTAVSPIRVPYGGAVTTSATLVRAGTTTRLAGRALTLRQRRHGTAAWSVVGRFVTGSTGVASLRRIPTLNIDYLWTLEGVPGEMGSTGAVRVVTVEQKALLTLSATRIGLGRSLVATATVGPNHRGQRVSLQQRIGSTWRNVQAATLSSTSAARFTIVGRTRGTQYFRVFKAADADHGATYSLIRTCTVV